MDSEEQNNPSKRRFFSSFFSVSVLVFFFLSFLFFSITFSLSQGKQLEKGNIHGGEDDT